MNVEDRNKKVEFLDEFRKRESVYVFTNLVRICFMKIKKYKTFIHVSNYLWTFTINEGHVNLTLSLSDTYPIEYVCP